jgi:hypothetical protein
LAAGGDGSKIEQDRRRFTLSEMLALRGTIVAADALNCQRAIASQVVEQHHPRQRPAGPLATVRAARLGLHQQSRGYA